MKNGKLDCLDIVYRCNIMAGQHGRYNVIPFGDRQSD